MASLPVDILLAEGFLGHTVVLVFMRGRLPAVLLPMVAVPICVSRREEHEAPSAPHPRQPFSCDPLDNLRSHRPLALPIGSGGSEECRQVPGASGQERWRDAQRPARRLLTPIFQPRLCLLTFQNNSLPLFSVLATVLPWEFLGDGPSRHRSRGPSGRILRGKRVHPLSLHLARPPTH